MKQERAIENLNFKHKLQDDNVFVKSFLVNLQDVTGMPCRRGLERAIISEDQIVNVVSKSYGHLPNENFFYEVESKLLDANIGYITRSINRVNRSFAVDYILSDDNWIVKVKNGNDKIRPMLRFTNSYDGSCKTGGHFGFFREVCGNGLHVAQSKVGFSVKHKGNIIQVVLPEIKSLVSQFMNNEFYSIHKKFEVLAERPISNLEDFVKITANEFKLFKFESSDSNPAPSLNARLVMDTIQSESRMLNSQPTLWHGFNAFNSLIHGKLKKNFGSQEILDERLFEHLLAH